MASSNTSAASAAAAKTSPVPEGTVFTVMIPWAETWVEEQLVTQEFGEVDFGTILKVDLVHRQQGKRPHQKIFIHFSEINPDYKAHLESGKEIKVFYNGSYFWKVRQSNYSHKDKMTTPKTKIELC